MIDFYGRFWPDYPGQPDPRYFPQQAPAMSARGQQPAQQQPEGTAMTPPMIHADIIQIESEKDKVIENTSVPIDKSQMFMTRDENLIAVKSATASGVEIVYYDRRPSVPEPPQFDPRVYPTRNEVAQYIEERLSSLQAGQSAPRSAEQKGASE